MQCPSCGFQNLPGLPRCARCLSYLDLDNVDVHPYRASDRWARLREWRINGFFAPLRSTIRRINDSMRARMGSDYRFLLVLLSLVPGLGMIVSGQRRFGAILLIACTILLLGYVAFMATTTGVVLLAMLYGVHSYAIQKCLITPEDFVSYRRAMAYGLATFVALFLLVYPAARWVVHGFVQFEPLGGQFNSDHVQTGDVLMVTGRWLSPAHYQVGDVVSYRIPATTGRGWYIREGFYIDRILATPGDHLVIREDAIMLNERPLSADAKPLGIFAFAFGQDTLLPADAYLILPSLAMVRAYDRAIEAVSIVPAENIRGRVIMIVGPPWRIGRI